MRGRRTVVVVAITMMVAIPAGSQSPARTESGDNKVIQLKLFQNLEELSKSLDALEHSHERYVAAAEKVCLLYEELSKAVATLPVGPDAAGLPAKTSPALLERSRQLQERQRKSAVEFRSLSAEMHHESRQFSQISNVMKTKHDTAKNAINNVR